MKTPPTLILLAVLVLFLTNCTLPKQTNASKEFPSQKSLQGTYWKLNSLLGNKILGADSSSFRQAYIIFAKDGRASGNAGCNSFGGTYTTSDSSIIKFGPLISTKMFCEGVKYENLFLEILGKTDNFLIENDTLYLRNRTMDSTAKFVAFDKKL